MSHRTRLPATAWPPCRPLIARAKAISERSHVARRGFTCAGRIAQWEKPTVRRRASGSRPAQPNRTLRPG
jgi:hypothetical protein